MIPRKVKKVYHLLTLLTVLSGLSNIYYNSLLVNISWLLFLLIHIFLHFVMFINTYFYLIYKLGIMKHNKKNSILINAIKDNIITYMVDFNESYQIYDKLIIIYMVDKNKNKNLYKTLKSHIPPKMFCIITNQKSSDFWLVKHPCKSFILANQFSDKIRAKRLMMGLNLKKIQSNPKDFLNKVAMAVNEPDAQI